MGSRRVCVRNPVDVALLGSVIYIDELQDMPEVELQALLSALHRCAQDRLPLLIIGTGLPRLRARVGNAKPYAERLFEFFGGDLSR